MQAVVFTLMRPQGHVTLGEEDYALLGYGGVCYIHAYPIGLTRCTQGKEQRSQQL